MLRKGGTTCHTYCSLLSESALSLLHKHRVWTWRSSNWELSLLLSQNWMATPGPIEWIAWTDFGLWVIDPTTLCKSIVTVNLGPPAPGTFYVSYVQRIAGKDRLVLIDIDKSDGYLPASVHNITSPCYPTK